MAYRGKERRKLEDDSNINPRIARIETELESVVRDLTLTSSAIRDLADTVQRQGQNFDEQLLKLHVAVTQAAGPRKTEWQTIISAVTLIVAIGASAMSPLYLRLADTRTRVDQHERIFSDSIQTLDNKLQNETKLVIARVEEKADFLQRQFDQVQRDGSPITRERLAVLESKIRDLKQQRGSNDN